MLPSLDTRANDISRIHKYSVNSETQWGGTRSARGGVVVPPWAFMLLPLHTQSQNTLHNTRFIIKNTANQVFLVFKRELGIPRPLTLTCKRCHLA